MASDPIAVGAPAPDFTLTNHHGEPVTLSKVLETHHALLYFVREFT